MLFNLSKKDVVWGYVANFFGIASGIIILPLILAKFNQFEVSLNYLMLTFGSLMTLFDFGFAGQFGRNLTYVFSGTQIIHKDGVSSNIEKNINYNLLATLISTCKFLYRRISFVALAIMLSFGSWYIYYVTQGFSNVDNTLIIWIIFCFSVFFQMYYSYYNSLLIGKGLIYESNKAKIFSQVFYIILAFVVLQLGLGLLGVVVSRFLSPFVARYISHKYFYTAEIKNILKQQVVEKEEVKKLFITLWFNAKKMGLVMVSSYAITKFGFFLSGLYLSAEQISSYGLMMQFVDIISAVAGTYLVISYTNFTSLKVQEKLTILIKEFSFALAIFYFMFIVGCFILVIYGQVLLEFIGSNVSLPNRTVILLYCLIILLEKNHSHFASLITIGNKIPFVKASIITGILIIIGDYLILEYTSLYVLGLIAVQGLIQLGYQNWKWPLVVCNEYNTPFTNFLKYGIEISFSKFNSIIMGKSR